MSSINEAAVSAALSEVIDPLNQVDLITAKTVKKISIEGGRVAVTLELGYPAERGCEPLRKAAVDKLLSLGSIDRAEVDLTWKVKSHSIQQGVPAITEVRNVLVVSSAKGGVGKSTTAVNLAIALHQAGARVGILDADIYGPSQPQMLGAQSQRPRLAEESGGSMIQPIIAHGVQSMSIGYLTDVEAPMIWRGPMATQALDQISRDTKWEDLDYLIVDMPPGTGDIQLTLSQKIPVSGAIIVTTPQDIALLDAVKGYRMFEKVKIPVLGVIENMSYHICSHCGEREALFGTGGGRAMAEKNNLNLLGELPLDIHIREQADCGTPTVVADPDGPVAAAYREIALRAVARLALRGKDYSSAFPDITVGST
ncbi:MAG: iron-sulfur cluster carrier protein ApbC [Gammaproteobacteria bacterium]|nr:iron-sulfur cluster carrier protein ApbC [Gammaproteobacteria bacterium]